MDSKTILSIFFSIFIQTTIFGQFINEDIDKLRKGDLIIQAKPNQPISIEQVSHEFWFGAAISNGLAGGNWSAEDRAMYKSKFVENFNSAVTENAVKWLSMEREKGKIDYQIVDGILAWADTHHIPLRGHNIFWGIEKYVQPWLKDMDSAALESALKNRAHTLASRYKGRFTEYDLNNEMIHGNYYESRLGDGITRRMADWFHEKDPDAKLFVNDYDITTGKKLNEYMAQIRKLIRQGVPLAGIGVQGHLHGETFDRNELKRSLDSLALFHLPIRITEFNIPGQRSKWVGNRTDTFTPEMENLKAKELTDFYRICFAHPMVEGILQWGFWAGANWIPVSSLYRQDWSPTPAADAYKKLIFDEWWTKANGTTNKNGKYEVRAFYGTYKITIDGKSKTITFNNKSDQKSIVF